MMMSRVGLRLPKHFSKYVVLNVSYFNCTFNNLQCIFLTFCFCKRKPIILYNLYLVNKWRNKWRNKRRRTWRIASFFIFCSLRQIIESRDFKMYLEYFKRSSMLLEKPRDQVVKAFERQDSSPFVLNRTCLKLEPHLLVVVEFLWFLGEKSCYHGCCAFHLQTPEDCRWLINFAKDLSKRGFWAQTFLQNSILSFAPRDAL